MKKIIITCLLATSLASAMAEWTQVYKTYNANFYIDYETIRKDGNLRKVWVIQDLNKRYKDGEMSRRDYLEFDCKNESRRTLDSSTHAGKMARGETLSSGNTGLQGWIPIPPDTAIETILKIF